jgi:hypothetical protein
MFRLFGESAKSDWHLPLQCLGLGSMAMNPKRSGTADISCPFGIQKLQSKWM